MGIDSDWENRILCSDGNCIGVIGPDGHCKECGKKYKGKLPQTFADAGESRSEAEEESEADKTDQPQAASDAGSDEESDDDDWANRRLCSDGNCIGVIGSDGRCKECGKLFEG